MRAGGASNGSVTTVESAKSLRDDTWVTLRGNIVERISDDLYVFKDASGTINVDIDHKGPKVMVKWETMWEGPDSQDVGLEAAII